ncbi:tripartite tricarboxylate transporter TctB family protein [Elioraea tepidiphila]|uniref:tripartite tricarboxylate transporter TctB family protein n=1 Tax=Elioraea tepidiphila TaxID=457934 RepID=UPI000382B199|nr:tripartite tricarboxylate transporter TctB family protein [Elioraea tepidiphila]
MSASARDIALGLAALVLAGAYWALAVDLPISLLSDAVGPGGVPVAIAMLMAAAGVVLILRSLVGAPREAPPSPAHGRAAGLLALLVAYVLAVPFIGYPMALGLLAGAIALYAGARSGLGLAAFAIGIGVLFWFGFVRVMGIPFPAGTLFGGI